MSESNGTTATTATAAATDEQFSDEQKQYLQGFLSGAGLTGITRSTNGTPTKEKPVGPEAVHFEAQDRFVAAGQKITPEEKSKREKFPLDRWDDIAQAAAENRFPKGTDVLAWKYHGLFYVAPAQDSFMARLRFAGGILPAHQLRTLADLAEKMGGGYLDCTTRSNLQIREIRAEHALEFLIALQDAGIVSRGSGADNIRNVTGSPLAGIDPVELADTRAVARAMHWHILNHREMYGLPRKFNIAFDGGGQISALEDTNDIGFSAIRVAEDSANEDGAPIPAGIYWRLAVGGITGHKDFARDQGLLLTEEQLVPLAHAIVRVFIENGDRTDRKKARLKYLLDAWGHEKFLAEVLARLPFAPRKLALEKCEPRAPIERTAHIGVRAQKQEGLFCIGVVLPVGRISSEQAARLAKIADRYGSGTIRLTVWQNLMISDIAECDVEAACAEIVDMGLDYRASNVRAGLVACTGKAGCKFALAYTKQDAMAIAGHVDAVLEGEKLAVDAPINIHVTGCHNSCAQHYVGDIGFMGASVPQGEDAVEGYHVFIGGGVGGERGIAQELLLNVPTTDAPRLVEKMLRAYLQGRTDIAQPFIEWARATPIEELKRIAAR
jgi:ferredoxin-nitrite reductase